MEAPTEHDCRCGARPARVWVQVADDVQPMCRACAHRASSDPVFLAGLAEAYREPCEGVLPPFRTSKPVVSPPPSPQSKGGQALAARLADDRDLRQQFAELGHRLNAMRRRCLGPNCDMATTAGALAWHQRSANHRGWEAIS
jgi:hypothetical protein